MKTRVLTGLVIGLVVIAFFALRFVSPYIFDIMIGVIMVCGAGEVSKVFNRSERYNNMTLLTLFSVAIFLSIILGIYFGLSFLYIVLIELSVLMVFLITTFFWTVLDKKSMQNEKKAEQTTSDYVFKKSLLTLGLFAYPSIILSFMFYLNHFVEISVTTISEVNVGLFLLVLLFTTTMLTDVCAYFVGSAFKGPKLCPYISPNKTISGAIGGILGSLFGAVIVYYIFVNVTGFADMFANFNLAIWVVLIYAFFASVFSQCGDIFASWLKRKARTKDFSTIFPGHGGFMDRCDGLAFNAVFTFVLFAILL